MDHQAALGEIETLADEADALADSLDNALERLRQLVQAAARAGVPQAELARRTRRHRNTIKTWSS